MYGHLGFIPLRTAQTILVPRNLPTCVIKNFDVEILRQFDFDNEILIDYCSMWLQFNTVLLK
jgi:hypothetical protein